MIMIVNGHDVIHLMFITFREKNLKTCLLERCFGKPNEENKVTNWIGDRNLSAIC